jgi:hypothetical protein
VTANNESFDQWYAENANFPTGGNVHELARAVWQEAARREREACEMIAISWSDKSYEADQIARDIRARAAAAMAG